MNTNSTALCRSVRVPPHLIHVSRLLLSCCLPLFFNPELSAQRIRPSSADVTALVDSLQSGNSLTREDAADALGRIGPGASPAIGPLITCLSDPDPYVIGRSAEALSMIGGAAVPALIAVLDTGAAVVRWPACIALGKIGADAYPAVAALTSALGDSSSEVRWGAAVALGNMGNRARGATPALLRSLGDRDQDVRQAASLALEHIDPTAVEPGPDWRASAALIDTLMPRLMQECRVPGAAVTMVKNRSLVWSGRYGIADRRTGETVTEETMFEACSMTKPMFACLAMKLIEQGKLEIDRPLVDYLRPSSFRGQRDHDRITARMVLSHTSGLPNWRKGEEERDGPLPVTFMPGSRFGYSGEGFFYLQRVIEKITGEPLDTYARRVLLDPLGLTHTSFVWTEEHEMAISAGHDAEGKFLQKTRYTHANAAYSLYTSAADYALFLLEIMKPDRTAPHSLGRAAVDTMLSHQVAVTSREPIERPGRARGTAVYWGLGWSMNATAAGDIMHHSGANRSGFRCFSQFNPATGSGIVIMTNGLGGSDLWTRVISRIGNL